MDDDDLFNDLLDLGHEDVTHVERTTYKRSPFAYTGAKYRSLKHIIPVINQYLTSTSQWADHFTGSGVVSFNVKPVKRMMLNDRYSGIVAFFRALRDKRDELLAYLKQMPPTSREEWVHASTIWCDEKDDVKRAAYWFYMMRLSVIGKGQSFGRSFVQPYTPVPESLKLFGPISGILKNFVIENLDAIVSFDDYDSHSTVHYLDPPYLNTDAGTYEGRWTEDDMRRLLHLVKNAKGTVILSHYPNEMIDGQTFWTKRYSWEVAVTAEAQAFQKENNKVDHFGGLGQAVECLWVKENG